MEKGHNENDVNLKTKQTNEVKFEEAKQISPRKSVREKRQRQSFSPEISKHSIIKKPKSTHKTAVVKIGFNATPKDTGFCCALCKSPYVSDPMKSKRGCRSRKSRHNPSPKVHYDQTTGKTVEICNACALIMSPVRKLDPRPQLRDDDKILLINSAKEFGLYLAEELKDKDAERLYCAHFKSLSICGCLQAYLQDDTLNRAKELLSFMKESRSLSKQKSYDTSNKRVYIGLGNGQKRSKEFEDFILEKREYIRQDLKLCETASKQILLYSNNFLHKNIKTEERRRMKRTKCKGKLNCLPDIETLHNKHCCIDLCVKMALSHSYLLHEWRNRAQMCQVEARRVLAEMLTPSGGYRTNCYKFIHWITGCSNGTIQKVNSQMKSTRGNREPPRHGLRKTWEIENQDAETVDQEIEGSVQSSESLQTSTSVGPTDSANQNNFESHHQQLYQIQRQILDQFVHLQHQQKQVSQQLLQQTILQQQQQQTKSPQNNQNIGNVQHLMEQLNTLQQTVQQLSSAAGHIGDQTQIQTQPSSEQLQSQTPVNQQLSQPQYITTQSQPTTSQINHSPPKTPHNVSQISPVGGPLVTSLLTGKQQMSSSSSQSTQAEVAQHNFPTIYSQGLNVISIEDRNTDSNNQRSSEVNQGIGLQTSLCASPITYHMQLQQNMSSQCVDQRHLVKSRVDTKTGGITSGLQKNFKTRHKSVAETATSSRIVSLLPQPEVPQTVMENTSPQSETIPHTMMQINPNQGINFVSQETEPKSTQKTIQVSIANPSVVGQMPPVLSNTPIQGFVGEDGILNFITPIPMNTCFISADTSLGHSYQQVAANAIAEPPRTIQILQPVANTIQTTSDRGEQSFIITSPPANQLLALPPPLQTIQQQPQTLVYQLPQAFQTVSIQEQQTQEQQQIIQQQEQQHNLLHQHIQQQQKSLLHQQQTQQQQVQDQINGNLHIQYIQQLKQQTQIQKQPQQKQTQKQQQKQLSRHQQLELGNQTEIESVLSSESQVQIKTKSQSIPNSGITKNMIISHKPSTVTSNTDLNSELKTSKPRSNNVQTNINHPSSVKQLLEPNQKVKEKALMSEISKANKEISDCLVGKSKSIHVTTSRVPVILRDITYSQTMPTTTPVADGRVVVIMPDVTYSRTLPTSTSIVSSKSKGNNRKSKKETKTKSSTKKHSWKKSKTVPISEDTPAKFCEQNEPIPDSYDPPSESIITKSAHHIIPTSHATSSASVNCISNDTSTKTISSYAKVTAEQPLKIRHKSGNKSIYSISPTLPVLPDYEHVLSMINSDPDLLQILNNSDM